MYKYENHKELEKDESERDWALKPWHGWKNRRPERENYIEDREGKCLFFTPTPFSSIALLHAPFPSGQPGGQAGHRRPSFSSPCWPCCSFQTQSSSSGRTSARRDTKEGWMGSVWRPGTHSPFTPRTSWTEDSLAGSRRIFLKTKTKNRAQTTKIIHKQLLLKVWKKLNFMNWHILPRRCWCEACDKALKPGVLQTTLLFYVFKSVLFKQFKR